MPSAIPSIHVQSKELPLSELLSKASLVSSRSEARRVVLQGGVRVDGIVQKDLNVLVPLKKGTVVQVGKRRFVKIA